MSGYIGAEPIPKASRVLTEGTLSTDTQFIDVPGGFTPNNIAVYINGTRLRQTEYDDSDGSQIDLLEVFSSGTEYVVEEFRSFEIPNHYTKAESDGRYAQLSGGVDADFTVMPNVGGDPIVESGSNTDGEWTRWADGTQKCSNYFILSVSGEFEKTRIFPISFLKSPFTVCSMGSSTITRSRDDDIRVEHSGDTEITFSTTQVVLHGYRNNYSRSAISHVTSGRWK